MGGRGSSLSNDYGKDYSSIGQIGNIKILKQNKPGSVSLPLESRTPNRIYAVISKRGNLQGVSFLDEAGMRYKHIDLTRVHFKGEILGQGHIHYGYYHSEKGQRLKFSKAERRTLRIVQAYFRGLKNEK